MKDAHAPTAPTGPPGPASRLHDLAIVFASALVAGKPPDEPTIAEKVSLAEDLALRFVAAVLVERQRDPLALVVPAFPPLAPGGASRAHFVSVHEEARP